MGVAHLMMRTKKWAGDECEYVNKTRWGQLFFAALWFLFRRCAGWSWMCGVMEYFYNEAKVPCCVLLYVNGLCFALVHH